MICPDDGSKEFDELDCRECQWYFQCFKMWQHGNVWGKKNGEQIGDNYPHKNNEGEMEKLGNTNLQEQEVANSRKYVGDSETWKMIEQIPNPLIRLRYRLIFLKTGGKVPEVENDI